MAEQNETKKKPPLIPSNFVTLVQLKERFQREQREKEKREKQERREREEREKKEREQREREEEEKRRQKQEEEKENQSVRRREKGKPVNRRNARSRGGDGYLRKKTEELEVAMVCMVTARENAVEEAENGGFKSDNRGSKIWNRKEKRGNQFARSEYEVIEGEGQATSDNRKPDQLEAATVYVVTASENAVEEGGEGLENKREGFKRSKKKGKRKDKARAENQEVIGGGQLVLPSQSVDKETVPARRDSRRRGTPRHFRSKIEDESDGQLVEVSEKFEDLSVNGGSRREHRFSRDEEVIGGEELVSPSPGVHKGNVPGRSRREHRFSRGSAYGSGHGRLRDFRRPWEIRNAGMKWVKKGDGNAGEVQP